MIKTAIVIASDAAYYHLLCDTLTSIEQHRPDQSLPVFIMNVGLTEQQLSALRARVAGVVEVGWDMDFPARSTVPRWFAAMVARPFLPRYFPDFQRVLLLDADIWLQDWRAIDLLIRGSEDGSLAIIPEIHRSYPCVYNPTSEIRLFARRCYKLAWGEEMARNMTWIPMRNAGVFALRSDSPLWDAWAKVLYEGLQRNPEPLIDQAALNIAITMSSAKVHPLPTWCNWTCNLALPMYDPQRRVLVEPCLPYEQISIVHQISLRSQTVKLKTTDGGEQDVPLDYSGFQAMLTAR